MVDTREVGASLGQVRGDGRGRVGAAELGGSPVEVPGVDVIGGVQAVKSHVGNIELISDVLLRIVEDGRVAAGRVESVRARCVHRKSSDSLGRICQIGVKVDVVGTAESLISYLFGIGVAHVDD